MTKKNPEKSRARALQERTGWSYSECLRCVRGPEQDGPLDDLDLHHPHPAHQVGREQDRVDDGESPWRAPAPEDDHEHLSDDSEDDRGVTREAMIGPRRFRAMSAQRLATLLTEAVEAHRCASEIVAELEGRPSVWGGIHAAEPALVALAATLPGASHRVGHIRGATPEGRVYDEITVPIGETSIGIYGLARLPTSDAEREVAATGRSLTLSTGTA